MKKILFVSLCLVMLFGVASVTHADTTPFSVSLGYASTNKAEVVKLQNFLISQGYLHASATGSYLSMTQKAVADFQVAKGVTPAVGYFGPKTIAVANSVMLAVGAVTTPATVSTVSVTNENSQTASLIQSNAKTITWQSSTYPAGAGVDIHLLRKTSSNPNTYTLIRVVSQDTANDGQESWIPKSGETGKDVYAEITCSTTYKFATGCQSVGAPILVN